MSEHPVQQPIEYIVVAHALRSAGDLGTLTDSEIYQVGFDGVTCIEACTKSGMHADIPYVRVWRGDVAVAEFCQHGIIGVYFKAEAQS
jgi:hypothetical protein